MTIDDGTAFEPEFSEFPTLARRYGRTELVSRVLGDVKNLLLDEGEYSTVTVLSFQCILITSGTLHAFGSGTVYARHGAEVHAHDKVRVIAEGEVTAELHDNALGIGLQNCAMTAYDAAQITLRDFSKGVLHDNSRGKFFNFTQVQVNGNAQARIYDGVSAEIFGDHAAVRARGQSRVQITTERSGPSVLLSDDAKAFVPNEEARRWTTPADHPRIFVGESPRPDTVSLEATPTEGYQKGGSPVKDREIEAREDASAAAVGMAATPSAVPAPPTVAAAAPSPPTVPTHAAIFVPALTQQAAFLAPQAAPGSASGPTTPAAPDDDEAVAYEMPSVSDFGEGWRPLRQPAAN
ncbi:hypothetical protein EEB14_33390 [Rhodococcus sp. WS4]|nr:hypothetical protein EEB14_33390 [Rhodococcus sp. WS4]